MADLYTGYFVLQKKMQEHNVPCEPMTISEPKEYEDEQLVTQLNMLLSRITTLDEYSALITILSDMKYMISLRFLSIFFEALVNVEDRVWASAGMHPPIRELYDKYCDYLLDDYCTFVYKLESALVDWTKENGYFDNPEKYEFIERRNKIYADYITLVGEVIYGNYTPADTASSVPD